MEKKHLLTMVAGTWVILGAAAGFGPRQFIGSSSFPTLKPIDANQILRPIDRKQEPVASREDGETIFEAKEMWIPARDVMRSGLQGKTERLDSIMGYNEAEDYHSRQVFKYDSDGRILRRENSLNFGWGWQTVEEYGYEWSDEGLILCEYVVGYGAGMKYEYEYDDRGWGIVKVTYNFDGEEWIPTERGEYGYDDEGNMTEEYIQIYADGSWMPVTHNMATWTTLHRQASFEGYYWDGSGWVGQAKQSVEYFKDTENVAFMERNTWLYDERKFQLADRITQIFNDCGKLVYMDRLFWNEDKQDWSGNYPSYQSDICFNTKVELTYDNKNRMLSDVAYFDYEGSGEWFKAGVMEYRYTDLDNGDYDMNMDSWLYFAKDNTEINDQKRFARYDSHDRNLWMLQQVRFRIGDDLINDYEQKTSYDEAGNITRIATWEWDGNYRIPIVMEKPVYDDDFLISYAYNYIGDTDAMQYKESLVGQAEWDESDDEGWTYYSHFEYTHENGIRTSKFGWMWDGEEWIANFGADVVYDFSVSADRILFPDVLPDEYKIISTGDYVASGGPEFNKTSYEYCYSNITGAGIDTITGDSHMIYDGKVVRLNIPADGEAAVYNISGNKVASAAGTEIYVGNLPAGIYVVRVSDESDEHTLKITVR